MPPAVVLVPAPGHLLRFAQVHRSSQRARLARARLTLSGRPCKASGSVSPPVVPAGASLELCPQALGTGSPPSGCLLLPLVPSQPSLCSEDVAAASLLYFPMSSIQCTHRGHVYNLARRHLEAFAYELTLRPPGTGSGQCSLGHFLAFSLHTLPELQTCLEQSL